MVFGGSWRFLAVLGGFWRLADMLKTKTENNEIAMFPIIRKAPRARFFTVCFGGLALLGGRDETLELVECECPSIGSTYAKIGNGLLACPPRPGMSNGPRVSSACLGNGVRIGSAWLIMGNEACVGAEKQVGNGVCVGFAWLKIGKGLEAFDANWAWPSIGNVFRSGKDMPT